MDDAEKRAEDLMREYLNALEENRRLEKERDYLERRIAEEDARLAHA